jgi:hypothetical protein
MEATLRGRRVEIDGKVRRVSSATNFDDSLLP